jgi:glutamine amidotransferase
MKNSPRILIVDYRLGNLFSIQQACRCAGLDCSVSAMPEDLLEADGIILPGVGAFGDAMKELNERGLVEALKEAAARGIPIFGICLGMQLLFERSEEFGLHQGLSLLSGCVLRLPEQPESGRKLRIPNVGWNQIARPEAGNSPAILSGIPDNTHMYFVHSYFVQPEDPSMSLLQSEYGRFCYCSAVQHENILGVQFHPEKSGPSGIQLCRNWANQI